MSVISAMPEVSNKTTTIFLACVAVIVVLFCAFLGPHPVGDTPSYVDAIAVLDGVPAPQDFVPNRLLTTFLGLESMRVLSHVFGDMWSAWFFMNLLFYVLACAAFFRMMSKMFGSEGVAFLITIFLAANYGFLLFGLNYLMDIGGWAFYVFALCALYEHSRSGERRWLMWAATAAGVGGLFKEYAFLGGIAVAVCAISELFKDRVKRSDIVSIAAIGVIPTAILYSYVYHRFGYTYLDWLGSNAEHYVYASRIVEYIKSLGSLYNILAIIVLAGLWILWHEWKGMERPLKTFLLSVFVSILPIFLWPAITQRIMTVTVPLALIVAGLALRRWKNLWPIWTLVLIAYIAATFFMDSYVLNSINLPF